MKKLLFRILAFAIDILFMNIIIIALSNISFVNPNINKINEESNRFNDITNQYNKLTSRFEEIFYDNYIDYSESIEIQTDYKFFIGAFYELPINSELESDKKDKVLDEVKTTYALAYQQYNCKINKYNIPINVLSVILLLLYFGVFEWYLDGKTIGKKIFRLRTIDNIDHKNKIPLWKYLFKAVLISEVLFITANIVCANIASTTLDGNYNFIWYQNAYSFIYSIQYAYNILFLIVIFIRKDERSIHDALLGIRVALFDKNNNEVVSRLFNEKDDNKSN